MAKKATQTNEDYVEITQQSYDELVAELDNRKNVLREEIAHEIAVARELGDLSENHAYTVAMEKKDLNENRIADIEDILKKAKVVKMDKNDHVVRIGKVVEIQNMELKKSRTVSLVGAEETLAASPTDGKISIDSPIGKAINNAKVGDVVVVELPEKSVKYKVMKIA